MLVSKMENKSFSSFKCLRPSVFLLVFLLFSLVGDYTTVEAASAEICEACSCQLVTAAQGPGRSMQIVCDGLAGGEVPTLDQLVWEGMHEDRLEATFQYLDWKTIPKLPKTDRIVYLNFNYNEIRSIYFSAFAGLESLESLQISHNALEKVSPDVFKNLRKLSLLDLSHNKLSEFNRLDFEELTSLRVLYLGHNKIVKIPVETLKKLTSLEELDLSGNRIVSESLQFSHSDDLAHLMKRLTRLNLSSNQLTILSKDLLQSAHNLESLDLSNNVLESIPTGSLEGCSSLRSLDLSFNRLQRLDSLPSSLTALQLRHNKLSSLGQLPDSLQILDLSENQLADVSSEVYTSPSSLTVLNISGNALSSMEISRPVAELKVLDISFNQFSGVPGVLSSVNFPGLRAFVLDGNPLTSLQFPSPLQLDSLSANFLPGFYRIDADTFRNVRARSDNSSGCIDLSISNSNLQNIEEKSFQGFDLCHLDLSHNNLTTLSEDIAQWSQVVRGVNLQHNPWDCRCPLQWVLDYLLKDLYQHHSGYLIELRCDSPRGIRGLRFVQWYGRGKEAFCKEGRQGEDLQRSSNYILMQSSDAEPGVKLLMGNGALFITILIGIFVGLVLVGALIVYLVRGKYRHSYQVRRQMMKKRQAMSDAQKLNSTTQEQNETLKV